MLRRYKILFCDSDRVIKDYQDLKNSVFVELSKSYGSYSRKRYCNAKLIPKSLHNRQNLLRLSNSVGQLWGFFVLGT